MDDIYNATYDQLYDRLAAQVSFYPEARLGIISAGQDVDRLKEIIDLTERQSNVHLRSDARYMLAVLLLQMVMMPIAIARPSMREEAWQSMTDDLQTLMKTVRIEMKTGRIDAGREGISGHMMLDTINRSWSELQTTRFRLWGD